MKIQCLSVLLVLSCLTSGLSSSVQVHQFRSQKAVITLPNDETDETDGPAATETKTNKVETKTYWSGVSKINMEVSIIVAAVWVLVLGSAPILIYKLGDRKVTKSAMTLSCLMWVSLFGGLYLFTNIILFNSPHFDRVRSLTVIECTYFMTQVITTVGYGDITPAMPRGQVFVGAYVALSFFVIALLMSEMQALVMDKVQKYRDHIKERVETHARDRGYSTSTVSMANLEASQHNLGFKPEKPEANGVISSVAIFVSVAAIWVLFFHFCPGEEKKWLEAIYMSLITLTTVGFGAITPVTEAGMLFAAFFMFIGTSALVNVVQNFSTYILEMDQYESWCPKTFENDLKKFREKYETGHCISEEKFLILTLLQRKIVTEDQIDQIKEGYRSMLGSTGKLNLKGIAKNVSTEIDHEGLGDSGTEGPDTARLSPR